MIDFLNREQPYLYIHKLRKQAEKGDSDALEELQELNKFVARKVNGRLLQLENKGLTRWAYDKAQNFTQIRYDSRRYKLALSDPKELQDNLMSMHSFWNSQTSTAKGQQEVIERRAQAFKSSSKFVTTKDEEGLNVFARMSTPELNKFLYFLGKDEVRDFLKSLAPGYTSGELVELLQGAYEDNSVQENMILAILDRYLATRQVGAENVAQPVYFDEIKQYLQNNQNISNVKLAQIKSDYIGNKIKGHRFNVHKRGI